MVERMLLLPLKASCRMIDASANRTETVGAVGAVLGAAPGWLAQRENVRIAGFGLFATGYRAVRTRRNPWTGDGCNARYIEDLSSSGTQAQSDFWPAMH